MNLRSDHHQKKNKLNYYLQFCNNYQSNNEKSMCSMFKSQSKKEIKKNSPPKREHFSSSFYDGFQFVDRLTNNKMAYKEARKTSTSFTQFKKCSKIQDKTHISSLLSIYKKTKDFQLKSLKQKIFKSKNVTSKQLKVDKTNSFLDSKQNIIQNEQEIGKQYFGNFIERSRQKNKIRSFIDTKLSEINKAEFQRIVTEDDFNIKEEVIDFNQKQNMIKSTLDKEKINQMLDLRQRQQFQLGNTTQYIQKRDIVIFKDLTNLSKKQQYSDQIQAFQQPFGSPKINGKNIKSKQRDNFMEKMLTRARNKLKKQGQYLVNPSNQKLMKNMLVKKGNKNFILSAYKKSSAKTQNTFDIDSFSFQRKPQSNLIKKVKNELQKNKRMQTSMNIKSDEQEIKQNSRQISNKNIIYLLKNNFVTNLGIELSSNSQAVNSKDTKNNNLLHLSIKNQRYEILEMILKKVPYEVCRRLLLQKNNNKRTPKQLAKLIFDKRAIQVIDLFLKENLHKQLLRTYLENNQYGIPPNIS